MYILFGRNQDGQSNTAFYFSLLRMVATTVEDREAGTRSNVPTKGAQFPVLSRVRSGECKSVGIPHASITLTQKLSTR